MARNKGDLSNIDNSDLLNYPNGRIVNNINGNGTPVSESTKGDMHEFFDKAMRLYGITHNNLPDNETNGYQLIEAITSLASKNDFVLTLSESSNASLSVPLKIGKLKENENIILKASVNKNLHQNIIGIDNVTKTVSFVGDFLADEYVRMINTTASIVLIRLMDASNIDNVVGGLNYLKGASDTQEENSVSSVASTPSSNSNIFSRKVIGNLSPSFLATQSNNGLLSSTDKAAIDNYSDPASLIRITTGRSTITTRTGGQLENNFNFNYVDVFPPSGKDMSNFRGIIPSIGAIYFSGKVDGNDTLFCNYQVQSDKIRIICSNSETRADTVVQWLAIWI